MFVHFKVLAAIVAFEMDIHARLQDVPKLEHIRQPLCSTVNSEIGAPLPTNIIGRQVGKLRNQRGLSQNQVAVKCQRMGWDASRTTIAKLESGFRCVTDSELLLLARALEVSVSDLFPRGKRR